MDNSASYLVKKAWYGQQLPLRGPGWAHFVYGGKMLKVKLGAAGLVEHGTVGVLYRDMALEVAIFGGLQWG